MRQALLDWFAANARVFPWRTPGVRDAYGVMVAEALLQQTQAVRAAAAFERFMARFPTPTALAAASSAEVLEQWQGLGYYRRALRLRECAATLVRLHGATVPDDVRSLEALPGIGRYGARAIAAQAFGRDVVAVDANVRRVGARLFALDTPDDRDLERRLESLLRVGSCTTAGPSSLTEALIELGATVCTPRSPRCARCPLRPVCSGHASPESFPKRRAPRPRAIEVLHPLVARRGGSVALARRPDHGRWPGLWGFPIDDGAEARRGRALAGFDHLVTHRTLRVRPRAVAARRLTGPVAWLPLQVIAHGGGDHPVAALDRRLAARLLAADPPRSGHDEAQP